MTLLQAHLKMEPAGEGTHLAYEDANAAVMGYLNKKSPIRRKLRNLRAVIS